MTIRGYRARWLFRALGLSFSLAAIQGCGTTRPDPAAEETIARVSGLLSVGSGQAVESDLCESPIYEQLDPRHKAAVV